MNFFFFLNYRKRIIIKFYFFKDENDKNYVQKISERFERRRSIFVTKEDVRKDKQNTRIASIVPTMFTDENSK